MQSIASLPIPVAICWALDKQISLAVASGTRAYAKLDPDAVPAMVADLRTRWQIGHGCQSVLGK